MSSVRKFLDGNWFQHLDILANSQVTDIQYIMNNFNLVLLQQMKLIDQIWKFNIFVGDIAVKMFHF
jgi:hypothetical protein